MQFGLDFNLVEERVAGVDEVGRGPLCGPVVRAAVMAIAVAVVSAPRAKPAPKA